MRYSWILYFAALLAAILLHIAASSSPNVVIGSFNVVLIALVMLVSLADFSVVVFFAVGGGLILDIYSNLPFGSFMLTLLITAIALEVLFYNFFTNKSLYSLLLLGLIGTTIYSCAFLVISGFIYLAGWSNFFIGADYFWSFFKQAIANGAGLFAGFYLSNYLSKKFKPVFLR